MMNHCNSVKGRHSFLRREAGRSGRLAVIEAAAIKAAANAVVVTTEATAMTEATARRRHGGNSFAYAALPNVTRRPKTQAGSHRADHHGSGGDGSPRRRQWQITTVVPAADHHGSGGGGGSPWLTWITTAAMAAGPHGGGGGKSPRRRRITTASHTGTGRRYGRACAADRSSVPR